MDQNSERQGLSGEQKLALAIIGIAIVIGAALAVVFSNSSSSSEQDTHTAASAYPNGGPSNSRSTGGPIQAATVASLSPVWSLPLEANTSHGAYWSTPVIVNDVVFSEDSDSNVKAIALASGNVLWEKRYEAPNTGPNGVVVVDGRVYGSTTSRAFALNAGTGEEIWSADLIRSNSEQIEMAPGYHNGIVYVSTSPRAFKGGEVGTLWALDAKTGKKTWSFDTVPRSLWGNPRINYGGGLSQPPAFDDEGSMYFGVGSPGPIAGTRSAPWGGSRPGPNLYTGSIVKLDAETGKLDWYYQLTPHMLCDWDLQGPPILVSSGDRDLAVIGGKSGIVIAVDRDTGKLVWKRKVGVHNGHDNDGLHAMKGDYSHLQIPMTVRPGNNGGVLFPASTDGSTVFVPVVNDASTLISQERGVPSRSSTGELVALDVGTGAVRWKRKLSGAAYGATTVVNDLVFAGTLTGNLYAFETKNGSVAWEYKLPNGVFGGFDIHDTTLLVPEGVGLGSVPAQISAFRLGG